MPELPEVETIARGLATALTNRRLGAVVLTRRDIVHGSTTPLEAALPGRTVTEVRRRAKRIVVQLDAPARLVFHLGMSGRISVVPVRAAIEPHTHLRIVIEGTAQELRFRDPRRFGGVWLLEEGSPHVGRALGPLGVEPLETDARMFRRLLTRNRQIKALLLDQTVIAGLGNIYTDEALHAAGVHPLRRAAELDGPEAGRLLRAIKSTLRRAIRHNGTTLMDYRTATGESGSFQRLHRVYQREGRACRSCGTEIVRIAAAGRSTFLCPRCQPSTRRRRTGQSARRKVGASRCK